MKKYEKNYDSIPKWYKGAAFAYHKGLESLLKTNSPNYAKEVNKARIKLIKIASSKLFWQKNQLLLVRNIQEVIEDIWRASALHCNYEKQPKTKIHRKIFFG